MGANLRRHVPTPNSTKDYFPRSELENLFASRKARRSAVELSILFDSPTAMNQPLRAVVWGDDNDAYSFIPRANGAAHFDEPANPFRLSRSTAAILSKVLWDTLEHVGTVPGVRER